MPDVHLPRLDHDGGHSAPSALKEFWKILIEVTMIGFGVYLGIAGEGWRENVHRRELARQSLEQFRSEIIANKASIEAVKDYHTKVLADLTRLLNAKPGPEQQSVQVHLQGIKPVAFQATAWDVSLATQALGNIDRELVFALSEIYNQQKSYADLTRSLLQAMYADPPESLSNGPLTEHALKFPRALSIYYNDVSVFYEPTLLKEYNEVLPKIERALAGGR